MNLMLKNCMLSKATLECNTLALNKEVLYKEHSHELTLLKVSSSRKYISYEMKGSKVQLWTCGAAEQASMHANRKRNRSAKLYYAFLQHDSRALNLGHAFPSSFLLSFKSAILTMCRDAVAMCMWR